MNGLNILKDKKMQVNYSIVEDSILIITNELLQEWKDKFHEISIYNDIPLINKNDNETDYFSEIEVNFWHEDNTFATVFSIIIFMQNKQILEINRARDYIQEEIETCYNECVYDTPRSP